MSSSDEKHRRESLEKAAAITGTTVLRLTLQGVQMKNMDWFSESDVFWELEVPLQGLDGGILWQIIHRSEVIMDNNHPIWNPADIYLPAQKPFDLYKPIRLCFYDWEDHRKHQPMGFLLTTVHNLQLAKQQAPKEEGWDLSKSLITKMESGEEFGRIVVVDIDVQVENDGLALGKGLEEDSVLSLTLEGVDMVNMDGWFGVSDPFYVVETPSIDTSTSNGVVWKEFYKSETIMDNEHPKWMPAFLDLDTLCRNHIDKPIRISFFDWQEDEQHQAMGECITSVRHLLRSIASKEEGYQSWDLSRALCPVDADGQAYGKVVISDAVIVKK